MPYKDYQTAYINQLKGWASFATGQSSSPTLEVTLNTAYELNALKNSISSEQIIQLSNAYYDQVALGRSLKELYKTPKDYLAQLSNTIADNVKSVESLGVEAENQHESVASTIESSKSYMSLSSTLQKKLAMIKSDYD